MSDDWRRPTLDEMNLSIGKKARLYKMMYQFGPANGTMLFLPIDQGLEHGPLNFFPNPPSENPDFQLELALRGGYSGIVFHIGPALKHMHQYAGRVPLVLKINGKTNIPPDDAAFSPLDASVEDAVRLGADGIGYTLFVGSPAQDRDIRQLSEVRQECERFGMPLIVWAYPRGSAIEKKGGRDSLYAVDYAARAAMEFGADIIKLNVPVSDPERKKDCPKPYNEVDITGLDAVKKVVRSAGRSLVLFSGGGRISDDNLAARASVSMEGGAVGLIFGRNLWQRPMDEALARTAEIKEMMKDFGD